MRSLVWFAFASSLAAFVATACSGGVDELTDPGAPAATTTAMSPTLPASSSSSSSLPADGSTTDPHDGAPPSDASADSRASDSGVEGGTKCSGSTFALCDGFENGSIDTATWSKASDNTGNATIVVDTIHAYRGTHALHVHLPSGGAGQSANARLVETKTFPALESGLYGRVFLYLVGTPPGKHTPFAAVERSSPNVYYGTEEKNGGYLYAVQGAPGIDEGFGSATKIGTNMWMCLEFFYGNKEIRTWLNGTELTDIHKTDWVPASFQRFNLGLADEDISTINAGGFDAWFDELALSSTRVGCTN
jgi:hypothetical protein